MLTEATERNIARKAPVTDDVHFFEGTPLPSWVELSPTELCNRSHGHKRACCFCPRSDPKVYPNLALHMAKATAQHVADDLRAINFKGAIALCGYGEPLLHPDLESLVRCFSGMRVEIITNGDRLTPDYTKRLIDAGVNYFAISMYDGPEQRGQFDFLFDQVGVGRSYYILRDRWHDADQDFGLMLTNRAGMVSEGHQQEVDRERACFYPSYQMMIDWNGDVLMCPQDWVKKIKFGNVNVSSIFEIWTSKALHKHRTRLHRRRDGVSPCEGCNANGQIHGAQHVEAWRDK
jgi:radical SAM protein with 4Fe4S-binding SPASM domain